MLAIAIVLTLTLAGLAMAVETPDLSTVEADLVVPAMQAGQAGAGCRIRQQLPQYNNTDVYHALYLPTDWKKDGRYPVIVEYAGNGNYHNEFGDESTGRVEGSKLGYGLSGGKGFIWICLPYVDTKNKQNAILWWGDADATVAYCLQAVQMVCRDYGGDRRAVILTGFSRGAIACNYIGLRNDKIAALWAGVIAYSHYDGEPGWKYEASDRDAAIARLSRLGNRPVFVCSEKSITTTRKFIESSGLDVNPTYCVTPFRNHNDAWVLRPTSVRQQLRQWLADVVATWGKTDEGGSVEKNGKAYPILPP